MLKLKLFFCIIFISYISCAQHIKTIQLRPLQKKNFSNIVPLGTILELSFDDLEADSKSYQYKIEHMTHNWEKSNLIPSQYVNGFNQNAIFNVTNSFNTLQNYTHYSIKIPNTNTQLTKSGNYLISVLDDYDDVVFTRRFVLYENLATVAVSVERSRNTKTINSQQTVQFSINHPRLNINNPNQEVNVTLLKNNNWSETISNIAPTFFKPNQLLYTYTNQTNFWGDNEYLNFDSKVIRNKSLQIVKITQDDVFNHYLYPYKYNPNKRYTFSPDINGQFVVRSLEGNDDSVEADYARMHFTIETAQKFKDKNVYVYGAFNDFLISDENKMTYNKQKGVYTGNILLKQGFYNYTYVTVDNNNTINTSEINGSFFQTENEYTVIAYYKPLGGLYDRVIGVGNGYFNQNR